MGELRASLYDIFGYLIPGIICAVALKLFSWTLIHPEHRLDLEPFANITFIVGAAIVCYLFGHLVHAVGNWLHMTKATKFEAASGSGTQRNWVQRLLHSHFARMKISQEAMAMVNEALRVYLGTRYTTMNGEDKFSLIDELQIAKGKGNDREMYIYREGFYRGMAISCFILFLSLCFSLLFGDFEVSAGKEVFIIHRSERVLTAILTAVSTVGFWRRMVRFSYYRITRAAATFLLVSEGKL